MKKIKDELQLLADIQVFDQEKKELKQFRKEAFLWNIQSFLGFLEKDNQQTLDFSKQELLLDYEFDKKLLEEIFFEEKIFQHSLEIEIDSNSLSNSPIETKLEETQEEKKFETKKVEVKVKLANFETLTQKFKTLLEQNLSSQEYNLQLILENQKLKKEAKKQTETFTQKIKTLEEKASQEVQEVIQKSKQNLEERFEKDFQELKRYGNQKFFSEFLAHFITFSQVIKAGQSQENDLLKNYVRGFEMIISNMMEVLKQHGLEKIEPEVGSQFDANFHLAESFTENSEVEDAVIVELKTYGFKLFERLLIPASVVVNKKHSN